MMRTMKRTVACAVVLVATAAQVQAGLILYTDRADFLAATTSSTNIDFEENGFGGVTAHGSSAVFSGVTFSAVSNLFTVDPDFNGAYVWGSGDIFSAQNPLASAILNVALPSGISAAGSDIMAIILNGSDNFRVVVNGTDVFTVPSSAQPTRAFVGFTTDDGSAISSLSFQALTGTTSIDNFVFGEAAQSTAVIPEPTSLALLGTGIFGLVGYRWRRRKTKLAA